MKSNRVPSEILEGIALWKSNDFFNAHCAWETYWHSIRKNEDKYAETKCVQGLIQLACALVHHERKNPKWSHKLLNSGSLLVKEHDVEYELDKEFFVGEASRIISKK